MSEELSAQQQADELLMRAAQYRQKASELEDEARAWVAGAEGERLVAATLDPLAARGAVVLHDRLLNPGVSKVNLDHIVASTAGVFLIDAKNWSGDVTVYEGNLWQHAGSSERRRHLSKHVELDKVSRAAASMERVLHGPVVPVIALANPRHSRLTSERVRGVQVLPVSQLVRWLEAQTAWLSPAQIDSLHLTLDAFFPPATLPLVVDPHPTPHAPRRDVGRSRPLRPGSPHRSRTTRHERRVVRPSSGWRRVRAGLLLIGVGALLLNLNRIVPAASSLAQQLVAPAVVRPSVSPGPQPTSVLTLLDGSPAPWKPCAAVSTAVVQDVFGLPVTEHDFTRTHDQCGWHLTPPTNPYVPADVVVSTGWTAKNVLGALNEVKVTATGGAATMSVPQHATVPGTTTPASAITQPFQITYRYTYPANAKSSDITAADKNAADKVTRLGQTLAPRLPQGPGADDTSLRFGP